MEVWQIILITLLAFFQPIEDMGIQIVSENKIIYGVLAGLIMGDVKTGLYIGAACHLMSLGVVGIGGASVPNYNMAAIVGTVIAVSTGQSAEIGVVIGSAVGMLGVEFGVIHSTVSGFMARKAESYCDQGKFKQMEMMIVASVLLLGLLSCIPTFIVCVFGGDAVNAVLNALPAWFTVGLSAAGGMLPAVGMAMLLNYMPVKEYFGCLLVGFALAAFAGWGIIPVAMVGGAWALEKYKSLKEKQNALASVGGLEDE